MGSKGIISKKLLTEMLPHRKPGQTWVEPFVGSGGIIQHVTGKRIGGDVDECMVAFLNKIRDGWVPEPINREDYNHVKNNKSEYAPEFLAYVGYGCSFGAKWFGGFAKSSDGRDYSREAIRSIHKQAPMLYGAEFCHAPYNELNIPEGSFIYCDPPYQGAAKYKNSIDHTAFWQWCRDMTADGHTVFVSEYSAPDDFTCVFELVHRTTLNKNQSSPRIERLFRHVSCVGD